MVGNLPYNISSPILFSLLRAADDGQRIADATVMLQKEVVDRLTASPGSGDYGTLAVQAAAAASVERLLVLPPGAFRPPPKVWSAVVRLRFRPSPFDRGAPEVFERIVRGIFLQRRKTLRNALGPVAATFGTSAAELLEKTGLDGTLRPQDLPPAAFGRLAGAVL
jgi:16S rRNA (adenine1518-N6/adenine1519-N6)-dimethyltransferase